MVFLRQAPRKTGSARTLHAFGGDSLLMFTSGGHRCGTGMREISWFFTFPRSGIEDSREFPSSQIPGKSFGFLPSLSSMPPERSLKATNGRETRSFGCSRLSLYSKPTTSARWCAGTRQSLRSSHEHRSSFPLSFNADPFSRVQENLRVDRFGQQAVKTLPH